MTTEDEVRAMLRQRAADPTPTAPPWETVARTSATSAPIRPIGSGSARRRTRTFAIAAAVVVAVGLVGALATRTDEATVVTADDPGPTTPTTAQTPPPDTQARSFPLAVWPATTDAELLEVQDEFNAGGRPELSSPLTAASAYLRDRTTGAVDVKMNEFREGDSNSGEAHYVVGSAKGGVKGTVLMRRSGEDGIWTVLGSEIERVGVFEIAYDGTEVTGSVATVVSGDLKIRIQSVDGSDPVSEEPVRMVADKTHVLDQRFSGKPGVILRFTFAATDGITTVSEVRVDVPAAPGAGGSTSGQAAGTCSTSAPFTIRQQQQSELPAAVAEMRKRIIGAALACDYAALDALALEGGKSSGFTFTYGDPGSGPGEYWRAREAEGEPVLRLLVQTLTLRPQRQKVDPNAGPGPEPQWAWPAVAGTDSPTEQDWNDLREFYSDREVDEAKAMGSWFGYRAAITTEGDWISFVAGD